MNIAKLVKYKVDNFDEGQVFSYADFDVDIKKESALKIAIYRLVKSGKIERLSKGRFYKPKPGIVKNLRPDDYEIVKDLLEDGDRLVGYITGYSIFNSLKLTTQVPNVIQIATKFDKKGIRRDKYTIKFVRQWNEITRDNTPLLQLLDCIRFIKRIPDTNIVKSISRLSILIDELADNEKEKLVKLAINYPPSTRALLGAILEYLADNKQADKLKRTLKASTWYSFNIPLELLPNILNWKIK